MKTIKEVIMSTIENVAEEQDLTLVSDFNDDTVLLDSGLDSLSFAILVADLEGSLGYDPFTMMDTPVYPRTLSEFVSVYQKFENHRV